MRRSIEPTYDHRETGDRFTVETRVNDRRLRLTPIPDPFVFHRITVGWRDILRALPKRLKVEIVVGGDPDIVEDILELNSDYLGLQRSTRRQEWNDHIEATLAAFSSPPETDRRA